MSNVTDPISDSKAITETLILINSCIKSIRFRVRLNDRKSIKENQSRQGTNKQVSEIRSVSMNKNCLHFVLIFAAEFSNAVIM